MRVLLFILASVISGCAGHPLMQEITWKDSGNSNWQEQSRLEQNEKMARIRAQHPDWDKAVSDDVLVVECASDDQRTACLGR